jgi:hypothetical protein
MRRTYTILIFFVLLVSSLCCIFSSQRILNGCFWWECAPKREFHVQDWEIPNDLLPEGSVNDHIANPSEGIGELEGGFQTIYIDNGIAVYDIYRFPRAKDAISHFEHYKRGMTDPRTGKPWEPPKNFGYSSTTADDFYIACGYFFQEYRCETAARYQEHTIFFGATIDDKMSYTKYEKIVVYLDEQISSRLYP